MCSAKAWQHSTSNQHAALYSDRLSQRIASIHTLETQLAFASQRWFETLVLLDKTPEDPNTPEALVVESNLMRIECCIQLQRWSDAEKSTEALQTIAEENLAQISPPSWLEKYLLRKAEIAMVLGKWKVAESDVWKIRTHFPECKVSTQVDYVLARCLVNDAKFEEARQLLASVLANQPPPPAPLQIKVWWTMAESYLMQRNYPAALAAYEQVAKLGVDSPWASIAQRQMAICQQAYGSSVASGSEPNIAVPLRSTQKQTPKQPR
jgi:tetratricopeptide (TPR) repeat protein